MTLHMNINFILVKLMINMAQNDMNISPFFKLANVCCFRLPYRRQYTICFKLSYIFGFWTSIQFQHIYKHI